MSFPREIKLASVRKLRPNKRNPRTHSKKQIDQIVSYVSHFMTLCPGDLITTGTPPGVGLGQKPHPKYLKPGDVIELGIGHLGKQRQRVLPWSKNGPSVGG